MKSGSKDTFYRVCENQTLLIYRRNDWFREYPELLRLFHPDTVVANRGAWYADHPKVLKRVEANMKFTQQWEEKVHFIWKTSVPGHPYCEAFSKPVENRNSIERYIENLTLYSDSGPYKPDFHWYDFKQQNALVVPKILEYIDDFDVIDSYATNVLRPDEHISNNLTVGCLHNCQPGSKTLLLNQWLLHLQRLRGE